MSHVLDPVECRQCVYKEADRDFDCQTSDYIITCRSCGYYESWTTKHDQAGNPYGWTHEIDRGCGVLCYRARGAKAYAIHCLGSAQELPKAERWLRRRLAKREVDRQNSYLTRWNNETKKVELVIGKFYEFP